MTSEDEVKGGASEDEKASAPACPPKRGFPSRFLEKAAQEQLDGPFGKLGRYALKQQRWGVQVQNGREEENQSRGEKKQPKPEKKGFFRRLAALLKRPFPR